MTALAKVTDADHARGGENADVTIIEFSDIQCSFCARFHETLEQLIADYGGKVNWVYRHFPLESIHPQARPAANAAECAGEQGKFWEFLDGAIANQGSLSPSYYEKLAIDLGLDSGEFLACADSNKYNTLITQQSAQAQAAGGGGTPHSVIVAGDTILPVRGAVPLAQLKSMIDPLLGGK
jgi:protein-disulfide isomerase